MHKLTGAEEYAEAHGLTKEQLLNKLQKLMPPCLITFKAGVAVKDYNALGICWRLYRPVFEQIGGIPTTRDSLFPTVNTNGGNGYRIMCDMLYNQTVESRLFKLPLEKDIYGAKYTLQLCEIENHDIRIYAYVNKDNCSTIYELVEDFNEEVL